MADKPASLHATAVAMKGRGVLLVGGSGSGKSDLALRLIDRGATLIADDLCYIVAEGGRIFAQPAAAAEGRLHVRGIGIVRLATPDQPIPLALAARLGRGGSDGASPMGRFGPLCGHYLTEIALAPFEASAPVKLALALERWGL